MISRLLVPLDGSRLAEGVLPFVEGLARQLSAQVCFIQVIEPEWPKGMLESGAWEGGIPLMSRQQQKAAEDYLSEVAKEWQEKDINANWEVVEGMPATGIIDFARSHEIDLIAMSTHGRSGIGRLVFGSVAEQVLRGANVPVLLLKANHAARGVLEPAA